MAGVGEGVAAEAGCSGGGGGGGGRGGGGGGGVPRIEMSEMRMRMVSEELQSAKSTLATKESQIKKLHALVTTMKREGKDTVQENEEQKKILEHRLRIREQMWEMVGEHGAWLLDLGMGEQWRDRMMILDFMRTDREVAKVKEAERVERERRR